MRGPKSYGSIEEFEREELRVDMKVGWSLDDLYAEALDRRPSELEESDLDELEFED